MNEDSLADRLKVFRAKAELTQRELATRAGVSGPYLAQIESGERLPSTETLIALSRILMLEQSQEEELLKLNEHERRGRLQDRAKNRQASRYLIDSTRQAAKEDVIEEEMSINVDQFYINRDLSEIRQGLLDFTAEMTQKQRATLPSVCLLGLGRCGTNIAVGVSTLAYRAKKAFLSVASKDESETEGSKKKSAGTTMSATWDWLRLRLPWRRGDVKPSVYLVEPIVLVGDLDVDIGGRIRASEYRTIIEAGYSKLKILDLSDIHHVGAGNVPLVGQYLAKIVLNRDPLPLAQDSKWKNFHSYLIDSAGLKENPSRVFFYIFSAGGGTGSGMSSEFGLAQQYSYHHRVHDTSPGVTTDETVSDSILHGFEPIFSAGIGILPHFNPESGEFSQGIHVNAGRLICKYLSEEWQFSRSNVNEGAEFDRILRPWNALMLISNNIMRYVDDSEGQKVDVAQMEKNANQYVSQQIFNILTAHALTTDYLTTDYDEQFFRNAGINISDTIRLDANDLYMSLTGPVAIAYAESLIPEKDGNVLIDELFLKSIALPNLNKETHAIEGISVLPQASDQYSETLQQFRVNESALNNVKCFVNCSSTVTIISLPKSFQLPNSELSKLKRMLDKVFPNTRLKRYALVAGASSNLSLTTLIARSACLSDEVLTLLFAYIKRCFAKDQYKYSTQIEDEIKGYLVEKEQDETMIREILRESEEPSEIMEANWEEVKSMYERKYRDFLLDPSRFVAMDSVRLKTGDVINALKYIAATLRHQSVPVTPTDVTSWEVKK